MHAVLLERGWFSHIFFPNYLKIGNIFAPLAMCLGANFFFYSAKFRFFYIFAFFTFCFFYKFLFFFNSTYIRVFSFRQIFKGKSYIQLIFELTYIRECMVSTFFIYLDILPTIIAATNSRQEIAKCLKGDTLHFAEIRQVWILLPLVIIQK